RPKAATRIISNTRWNGCGITTATTPARRNVVTSRRRQKHELAPLLSTEAGHQSQCASAKDVVASCQGGHRVDRPQRAARAHAKVPYVPRGLCGPLLWINDILLVRTSPHAHTHRALHGHAGFVRRSAHGKLPTKQTIIQPPTFSNTLMKNTP